jgi:hypothetical protein
VTLAAHTVRRWIAAGVLQSWWVSEGNHGVINGPAAWQWRDELLVRLEEADDIVFVEACAVGNRERRELAVLCQEGAPLAEISAWCLSHQNSSIRVWDSLIALSAPPEALFAVARRFRVSARILQPLGRVTDMVREADETWQHTAEVLVREHGELPCEELIALVNSVVDVPVSVLEPLEGC